MAIKLDYITLIVELTYNCNFSCSYCSQNELKNNKSFMNFNSFKSKMLLFKRECLKHNIKYFNIILQGGELSMYDDSIKYFMIVKEIFSDHQLKIIAPTNFSGNLKFYKRLINVFDGSNVEFIINISLHPEFLINFEKNMSKLKILKKFNTNYKIEVSILKIKNYKTFYSKVINGLKGLDIFYFFEELDHNIENKTNGNIYILNLTHFIQLLTNEKQTLFKINNSFNIINDHIIHKEQLQGTI